MLEQFFSLLDHELLRRVAYYAETLIKIFILTGFWVSYCCGGRRRAQPPHFPSHSVTARLYLSEGEQFGGGAVDLSDKLPTHWRGGLLALMPPSG